MSDDLYLGLLPFTPGVQARADGEPISACPYAPVDPAGASWRSDWIEAEAAYRQATNRLGATDDEYRAAGLNPPRRGPGGAPLAPQADSLPAEWVDAISKAFHEVAEAFREIEPALRDLELVLDDTPLLRPAPACPVHGTTHAGLCRPCSRCSR